MAHCMGNIGWRLVWLTSICIAILISYINGSEVNTTELMIDVLINSMETIEKPVPILYASFISSNIYSYASYCQLYNSLYFKREKSVVRYFTEDTGHNYSPKDKAWNKVAIMAELLHRHMNSGDSSISFIAFIDADILLLPSLSSKYLQSIMENSPSAEIFMSQDAVDFANSGFIISRISPWALLFFTRWWEMRSIENCFCDQHVLNMLSLQLEQEQQLNKIAILPFGVINSKWPSLENFNPISDKVLHLLGEYDFVRVAIAKYFVSTLSNGENMEKRENVVVRDDLVRIKLLALHTEFNRALQHSDFALACNIASHFTEMELRHQLQLPIQENDLYWGKNRQLGVLTDIIDVYDNFLNTAWEKNNSSIIKEAQLQNINLRIKIFPFSNMIDSSENSKGRSAFQIFMTGVMQVLENIQTQSDSHLSHLSNSVLYHYRLLILDAAINRIWLLLNSTVTQSLFRDIYDQQRLWEQAWSFCEQGLNDANSLLFLAENQLSSHQLPHASTWVLQKLKFLHQIVQLQLLKPTLFGFQERNSAWLLAHEKCDESMILVESLQNDYQGEMRLLVNQVKDILSICVTIYAKRKDSQLRAEELMLFISNMKYFGKMRLQFV